MRIKYYEHLGTRLLSGCETSVWLGLRTPCLIADTPQSTEQIHQGIPRPKFNAAVPPRADGHHDSICLRFPAVVGTVASVFYPRGSKPMNAELGSKLNIGLLLQDSTSGLFCSGRGGVRAVSPCAYQTYNLLCLGRRDNLNRCYAFTASSQPSSANPLC